LTVHKVEDLASRKFLIIIDEHYLVCRTALCERKGKCRAYCARSYDDNFPS
jgi:hypothetical protein